jgi:Ser/Thr protein kinase RdoA (MazF antagonist)
MLDVDSAVGYLLDRKLVDRDAIIDGDLQVISAARRNRNLRVETSVGGYLIKQPDDPAFGGRETLNNEAAFYTFCQNEPAVAALAQVLPRLIYYDPDQPLLALELLRNAAPFARPLAVPGGPQADVQLAGAVGAVLGLLHATFRRPGLTADARLSWLPRQLPWVLLAHKPEPEILATISPANYQALRILQTEDGLAERLDQLRKQWQPDTVIHGDIRSDNLLVVPPAPGASQVRLVDWELVQYGDAAWDVGGLLQDVVSFWIASMPLSESLGVDEMAARAGRPWPALQAALRGFWQAYRRAAGLAPADTDDLLTRAVSFSAARMIQTAYEMAQLWTTMPPAAVLLLQVSANVLADPEGAPVRFYGIFQS